MRELLGSSLHVPVTIDGKPGTVNFWSKEKNAFPPRRGRVPHGRSPSRWARRK